MGFDGVGTEIEGTSKEDRGTEVDVVGSSKPELCSFTSLTDQLFNEHGAAVVPEFLILTANSGAIRLLRVL